MRRSRTLKFSAFCLAGYALLYSATFTGCSDQIAPPIPQDTTSQLPDSAYTFLYAVKDPDTKQLSYRSSLEDGTIGVEFGSRISRSPSGSGKAPMITGGMLYAVDLNTGTPLSAGFAPEGEYESIDNFSPAISTDGNRLAWTEENYAEGKRWGVLADADGTNRIMLPVGAARETCMRFSPDGTHLAFFSYDEEREKGELYRINADDGGDLRLLAETDRPMNDGFGIFDWSPDGSQIVFSHGTDIPTIYVVNNDGTGLRSLAVGFLPDWSPYGSKILFTSTGNRSGLAIINSDGTGGPEFLNPSTLSLFGRWSPDGKRILYAELDSSTQDIESRPAQIRVMHVATRKVTTVSSNGKTGGLYWVE